MTLSSNQPYFFPYLPYWQLIDAADLFLVGDDFAFMKGSWIARNFIMVNGTRQFFRIEIEGQSCHSLIRDLSIVPDGIPAKLRTLEMAYHRSPCFAEAYPLLERILLYPDTNLSAFLTNSITEVCAYLGITTRIGFTSDVPGNSLLRREERIYDLCRQVGADVYVNASGGRALYSPAEFRRRGLELRFINSGVTEPISVIHALMNYPREQLREMLDKRTLDYE